MKKTTKRTAIASSKTATLIKNLSGFKGNAALYKLSHMIAGHQYVIVSAAVVCGYPETYIFRSNKNGEVVSWMEINGSQKGTLDHEKVLNDAGFKLVKDKIKHPAPKAAKSNEEKVARALKMVSESRPRMNEMSREQRQELEASARATIAGAKKQPDVWTYSSGRAMLRKNGVSFAIVTPDGTNALKPAAAKELLSLLNGGAK